MFAPMGHWGSARDLGQQKAAEDVVHVRPKPAAPSLDEQEPVTFGSRSRGWGRPVAQKLCQRCDRPKIHLTLWPVGEIRSIMSKAHIKIVRHRRRPAPMAHMDPSLREEADGRIAPKHLCTSRRRQQKCRLCAGGSLILRRSSK